MEEAICEEVICFCPQCHNETLVVNADQRREVFPSRVRDCLLDGRKWEVPVRV